MLDDNTPTNAPSRRPSGKVAAVEGYDVPQQQGPGGGAERTPDRGGNGHAAGVQEHARKMPTLQKRQQWQESQASPFHEERRVPQPDMQEAFEAMLSKSSVRSLRQVRSDFSMGMGSGESKSASDGDRGNRTGLAHTTAAKADVAVEARSDASTVVQLQRLEERQLLQAAAMEQQGELLRSMAQQLQLIQKQLSAHATAQQ